MYCLAQNIWFNRSTERSRRSLQRVNQHRQLYSLFSLRSPRPLRWTMYLHFPVRIISGVAARADEDDFAGVFCCPHKWRVETIVIPALGTDVEFLIYFYWNWLRCPFIQHIPPSFLLEKSGCILQPQFGKGQKGEREKKGKRRKINS